MKITDAVTFTKALVKEYNLDLPVVTTQTTKQMAQCVFSDGLPVKIELSSPWIKALEEEDMKDVILQEIASAIVTLKDRYSDRWYNELVRLRAHL